jgi:hypothetical protein
MSNVNQFLDDYANTLSQEMRQMPWPQPVLDTYEFENCLKQREGRGVYLVVDRRTGGRAILRVFDKQQGDAERPVDAEWAILSQLDHPGLPKVYGSWSTPTHSIMSREFVQGQSLDAVVARGLFSYKDMFAVVQKLCEVLAYLHAQNPPVIHRDIKPQNIILCPDGSIKLIDFGIARVFRQNADSDTVFAGTVPYAPPEQYGFAQTTPQTDIHALGITMIYMLTGSPERNGLEQRIRHSGVRALIERCIAIDPAQRIVSVAAVLQELRRLRSRRPRLLAIGIAAAAVLVLAVGSGVGYLLVTGVLDGGAGAENGRSALGDGAGAGDGAGGAGAGNGAGADGADTAGDSGSGGAADGGGAGDAGAGALAGSIGASVAHDSTKEGNLSGNLNNGGMAVLGDEGIYLSDGHGIYLLKEAGSQAELLLEGSGIKDLNYCQGTLYFATNDDIQSYDPSSGSTSIIVSTPNEGLFISDGMLYYEDGLDGLRLYRLSLPGSSGASSRPELIHDKAGAMYRTLVGGRIYYSDGSAYALHAYDLASGQDDLVDAGDCHWLSAWDGRLVYSDFGSNGAMKVLDVGGGAGGGGAGGAGAGGGGAAGASAGQPEILADYGESYNVATAAGVFYQSGENQAICNIPLEGGIPLKLNNIRSGAFCVVGDWIVYENKDDGEKLWMLRFDGTDNQALRLKG